MALIWPPESDLDKFPSRERQSAQALEPRVSAVVVVGRDSPQGRAGRGQSPLDLCLRSALSEPWIDELIIVNHGAPPRLASALRALCADRRDVRLVAADAKLSAASAANLGAEKARARWLLFLAPHVVLKRGAVERLAAAGGDVRGPWIAGGRLTDMRGRDRSDMIAGPLTAWSALAAAIGHKRARHRETAYVSAVSGAFMLIPRQDFEALDGFDPKFLSHGADLDLCLRAASLGGSVLFEPEAAGVRATHHRVGGRRQAQGLALFAAKSARTPLQQGFAAVAGPALASLLILKNWVAGAPPRRRRRQT